MSKKSVVSIVIAIIITALVAIFGGLELYKRIQGMNPDDKKYEDGEYRELEEWEKAFLTNDEFRFVSDIEKERVASGYLSPSQVKELDNLRKVNNVLKEKHPNYNCTITDKGYEGMFGSVTYVYIFTVEGYSDIYEIRTMDYSDYYDTFRVDNNN